MIKLDKEELDALKIWLKEHDKTCKYADPMKQGAIGGRISYIFTPTGLGTIVGAKCACGEETCLSACENW